MSEPAPIRPQRIIRANRETTGGLLMSVIRSLTTSRDSADRDRERLELEKGFQQCDLKLDDLINQHGSDLYQVMGTFSKILNNLSRSKERLIDTRDKLLNCQKLLHCKRDELKKLWLEMVENRAVFDLLERIEQINKLPGQVEAYAERKHYLHAAQCCVDGLRELGPSQQQQKMMTSDDPRWNSNQDSDNNRNDWINNVQEHQQPNQHSLNKIEALAQVRLELLSKKDMLFDRCLEELHRHLYIVSTEQIRRRIFQQQQQARNSDSNNNQMTTSASSMIDTICWNQIWNQNNLKGDSKLDLNNVGDDWRLIGRSKSAQINSNIENRFDPYPEEDSGQFIAMLTKCIGLLNKIPMAVKIIRQKFDEEFVNLVIRTAQDIIMINESESMPNYDQQNLRSIFENNPNQPIDTVFGNDSHRQQSANDHQLRDLVVLTCTRLLGHHYDGFSHLKSIGSNEIIDVRTLEKQMPKTSIQLRQLFNLLLEQFYYVIQLHQSIVLLNFKRIENGLHLDNTFSDATTIYNIDSDMNQSSSYNNRSTMFYTGVDIWCKIQLLLQQLLDYYLDVSQISGQSSSPGGPGLNYNLVSSLLPSAAMNMLFGVHSQTTSSAMMVPAATAAGSDAYAENYSSFFVKRRPMMVAGAMNAMNVMMSSSSGKNATLIAGSNVSSANQSSTTAPGSNSNAVDNVPDSSVNNSTSATNSADTGTANDINSGGALENNPVGINTNNQLQPMSGSQTVFSHGGGWRYQQCNLFKFDHSSQAISWNTFLQQQQRQADKMLTSGVGDSDCLNNDEEQNDSGLKDTSFSSANKDNEIQLPSAVNHGNINSRLFDSLQRISGQSPDNLVLLYDVLIKHLQQCPVSTDAKQQQHLNTLQSYLIGSSEKFTLHINSQLDAMLEQAQKSLESGITIVLSCNNSLQVPISSSDAKSNDRILQQQPEHQCHSGHVLLQSAVMVDVAVQDLNILMMAMKDYGQNYLSYICNVLNAYKDTCNRLYDTLTSESSNNTNMTLINNLASPQSQLALSSLDLYNTNNSAMGQLGGNNENRRSVLSAYWARNEDINRLLRSQPNWTQLKIVNQRSSMLCSQQHQNINQSSTPLKMTPATAATTKYETRRMMINRQMSTSSSFDESPEVIRQRNASEVDILINLLSQEIQKSEMIWQEGQLTLLANMQQSFEWLSARCDYLAQTIQRQQQESNSDKQTDDDDDDANGSPSSTDPYEVYIALLNQLSSDFEEISQLCMLVLHLEIRVHCYYHLQALDAQFFTTAAPSSTSANTVSDTQTSSNISSSNRSSSMISHRQSDLSDDIRIIPLLEDLERMYREISLAKLSPAKMGYLFEGLGHLMTTIFMNSAMSVRRIKPNGIKRACRAIYDIQRPLSNITKSRELSLDYARQYFEMLMLTPDEIMAGIIERGRQFKEEEYINAITLLHQSSLTNFQLENQQSIIQQSSSTNSNINTNNIINNGLDQHQSQQQLEHLLKRLNDILAEVTA